MAQTTPTVIKERIIGYAAIFDREAIIAGAFREKISHGAFADAIGRDDTVALLNHDPNMILGRVSAGTLTLREDTKGLRYEITPSESQMTRDILIAIKRGEIRQSSFSFSADDEEWTHGARGSLPLRTVRQCRLYDISCVVFPAYKETSVSVVSVDGRVETERSRQRLRLVEAEMWSPPQPCVTASRARLAAIEREIALSSR